MPGLGLSAETMLPERRAAIAIDQNARAPRGGIGLSTTPITPVSVPQPAPSPMAAPIERASIPAPAADTAASKPQEAPAIDFDKNPLGAIGMLLSNVAAGFNGQPLPSDQLRGRQLEEKAMQYKTAALAMDTMESATRFMAKMPVDQQGAFIDDFSKRFAPALGGWDPKPVLTAIADGTIKDAAAKIEAAKRYLTPEAVAVLSHDPGALDKVLTAVIENKATEKTPDQIQAEAKARTKGEIEGGGGKQVETITQIFNKAMAQAQGAEAGKPASRRFVEVNGKMQFLTDDEINTAQKGGATLKPANSAQDILATLFGGGTPQAGGGAPTPASNPAPASTPAAAAPANLPKVNTAAEHAALPKGTKYIGPDGKTYVKK